MLKVFSYLKKSIGSILIIVMLLVVQAMCDLSLPDYTSKIINVGVQQGGIETLLPEVIRKDKLEELMLFIDSNDKNEVEKHYQLIDKTKTSEKEYKKLIKKYPLLETEELYQLFPKKRKNL